MTYLPRANPGGIGGGGGTSGTSGTGLPSPRCHVYRASGSAAGEARPPPAPRPRQRLCAPSTAARGGGRRLVERGGGDGQDRGATPRHGQSTRPEEGRRRGTRRRRRRRVKNYVPLIATRTEPGPEPIDGLSKGEACETRRKHDGASPDTVCGGQHWGDMSVLRHDAPVGGCLTFSLAILGMLIWCI